MLVNVNVLNEAIHGRDGVAPYIGENGHWYIWDNSTDHFVDSGVWAGNGPTITEVYFNPDYTMTYYFGDGSSFTTPPIKGADGNKTVYWTNDDTDLVPEGYDSEGIWHSATTGETQLRSTTAWPYGYPEKGDYIFTKGGALLYCTNRGTMGFFDSASWVCVANMNGSMTQADELTIKRLYVTEYANLAGLVAKQVESNGKKYIRIE